MDIVEGGLTGAVGVVMYFGTEALLYIATHPLPF